jgi:hypothetical protein
MNIHCLTKSGSTFESVMTIICGRKGWAYEEKGSAAALVRSVVKNSGLDGCFDQPLTSIATLRNRYSTAHGSADTKSSVPPHPVRFALNATASAVLSLADVAGKS